MPILRPKIPIKKSKKDIELYLEYGPKFNNALLHMRYIVEEGIEWDIESKFKEFSKELLSNDEKIESFSYPFATQKNYLDKEFGHAICVSVGNVVAHGEPTVLKFGDNVSVDCGWYICFKNGSCLHFDSAFTTVFGFKCISDSWLYKPQEALKKIIEKQPKNTREISILIRKVAKTNSLKQVVSLIGHGCGYSLHEPPAIYNAPGDFVSVELFEGLVFCAEPIYIEPVIGPGIEEDKSFIVQTVLGSNGWEVLASRDEDSSHFETMFGVINGQIVDLIGVSKWKF